MQLGRGWGPEPPTTEGRLGSSKWPNDSCLQDGAPTQTLEHRAWRPPPQELLPREPRVHHTHMCTRVHTQHGAEGSQESRPPPPPGPVLRVVQSHSAEWLGRRHSGVDSKQGVRRPQPGLWNPNPCPTSCGTQPPVPPTAMSFSPSHFSAWAWRSNSSSRKPA